MSIFFLTRPEVIGHGSVSPIDPLSFRSGKTSSFSRERPKTARLVKEEAPVQQLEEDPESESESVPETDRSGNQRGLSFGTNRRNFREPDQRQRPVRTRQNVATETTKRRTTGTDLSGQASIQHESVSTDFGTKKRNSFRERTPGLTR